jgi:hypothetical protein
VPSFLSVVRRLTLASVLVLGAASCDNDKPTQPPVATTFYDASTFRVTPTGQPTIDVLAQGGSLVLAIASDGVTGGALVLPSNVTGGAALTASMAGTAVRSGSTVTFEQAADTFVRDLTWTVNGSDLQVVNQPAGGAAYTITLSRRILID